MLDVLLAKIIGRHLTVLGDLGCRVEEGQIVGDLARRQIKQCLSEMRMTGAKPDDIRQVFEKLETETGENCRLRDSKFFWILAMTREHVSFLLVTEGSHHADHGCSQDSLP